jgi:hypothetical protein
MCGDHKAALFARISLLLMVLQHVRIVFLSAEPLIWHNSCPDNA